MLKSAILCKALSTMLEFKRAWENEDDEDDEGPPTPSPLKTNYNISIKYVSSCKSYLC